MMVNDPLLSRIDVFLRESGHVEVADHLLRLQRDIAFEQVNDAHHNDGKDFGAGDTIGSFLKYWEPIRPSDFEADTDKFLEGYAPVTLNRFAIFTRIGQIFRAYPCELALPFLIIDAKFNAILSGEMPEQASAPCVVRPPEP